MGHIGQLIDEETGDICSVDFGCRAVVRRDDRTRRGFVFEAMQDAMIAIIRAPVWEITRAAIATGSLVPSLTEERVATYALGPLLYARLFERRRIETDEIERCVDVFLAAFAA